MIMPRFLALLEIKSKFCVARSTSYTDAPPDQIVFTVLTPSTKFHSLAVSQMEASYGLFGTHCVMVTLLYSAKFVYVGTFMTNEHWVTVASFEVTLLAVVLSSLIVSSSAPKQAADYFTGTDQSGLVNVVKFVAVR